MFHILNKKKTPKRHKEVYPDMRLEKMYGMLS